MKVSNHVGSARNSGFRRAMESRDARRQLHVSAAIAAIMAVALIAATWLPHGAYKPVSIKLTVQAPQSAHFEPTARAVNLPTKRDTTRISTDVRSPVPAIWQLPDDSIAGMIVLKKAA